jgi:hypothetical protein
MELEDLKNIWSQHEKMLVENTTLNKELLKKVLIKNAEKRIDWMKIKALSSLILIFIGIIFIVIPRIRFVPELDAILGLILFGSITVITYVWSVQAYLKIEKLNINESILSFRKQLKLVEKYKLRITRYGFILAPFMIVGIFLSVGITFLSAKMIPFYVLMVISFLIGSYVRSKHGLIAQIRKINNDIEEISNLETDSIPNK